MQQRNNFSILMILLIFITSSSLFSQEVGDILWQDNFDDTETDSAMHQDVGWFYYDESDGLSGAVVKQVTDR